MYGSAYTAGIESMVINLKAKMAEGDIIRITENTDSFRYIGTKKQRTEQDIWDKLNQKYQFKKRPAREEIAILKDNPNGIDQIGHPTLIELPSEAVVPIFIPGAPDQHLGYFVLPIPAVKLDLLMLLLKLCSAITVAMLHTSITITVTHRWVI